MNPVRVVEDGEFRGALLVTPILLVLVVVGDYGVAPAAVAAGLVVGPAVTYVKNVLVSETYRRVEFLLLVVGAATVLAFVGFVVELLWLLVGYNVGTVAVGLYERRVRPVAVAQ